MIRVTPLTGLQRGADVLYLQQREEIGPSPADRKEATRALLGAAILGLLDHYGKADLDRAGYLSKDQVTVRDLRPVVVRDDTGLHGCAFEYAIHETINGAPAIPEPIRQTVSNVISWEVGAIVERAGLHVTSWSPALRSVMFGLEKTHQDYERAGVLSALGDGALLATDPPFALAAHLPHTRCPSFSRVRGAGPGLRATLSQTERFVDAAMPAGLGRLWQTDLFLGGATVERSRAVRQVTTAAAPTAWVAASLKYAHRAGSGGHGLGLLIETSHGLRTPRHETTRSVRAHTPVLTLPLQGDFLLAFNAACGTLRLGLERGLTRRPHPAWTPEAQVELAAFLAQHRDRPARELAAELLRHRPGLVEAVPAPGRVRPGARPLRGPHTFLAPLPALTGAAA